MSLQRSLFRGFLITTILLVNFGRLWAHAIIVESTPQKNSVVSGPVLEIKLKFNTRVDGKRSKLSLIAPDGRSHVVMLSQQTSPDTLLARTSDLVPGKYQLHWQVLASDGHITQGNIPFSVANR